MASPFLPPLAAGEERRAGRGVEPPGFHLKPPPAPHLLSAFITSDAELFETIHVGPAVVDAQAWRLAVDGLVDRPFALDLAGLRSLPATTVTAFHECFGSPLAPATRNLHRVGNVRWTGVRLSALLAHAGVQAGAAYVWSEGLDGGEFAGRTIDRYAKDLPLAKALGDEVLVAYEMNGEPLGKERGGPVRLVVPGWFGTNMTKWLCRLSVQRERVAGPFPTTWYNERVQADDGTESLRPVWEVAPNSLLFQPQPDARIADDQVDVMGWAWAGAGIERVEVSVDGGQTWQPAQLAPRREFEWQRFEAAIPLAPQQQGELSVMARATDRHGQAQPMAGTRNAVHAVPVLRVGP